MKNKYSAGANFERRLFKVLEREGAYVIRSAGSKGAIDIVALFDGAVGCYQCQLDLPFPPAKREALIDAIRNKLYCQGFLVWRGDKKQIMMEQIFEENETKANIR